jgi:hypothetical protein
VQRLRELGWIEGRTVAIEHRWGEGQRERYVEIAAEFVQLKVDITRAPPANFSRGGCEGLSEQERIALADKLADAAMGHLRRSQELARVAKKVRAGER